MIAEFDKLNYRIELVSFWCKIRFILRSDRLAVYRKTCGLLLPRERWNRRKLPWINRDLDAFANYSRGSRLRRCNPRM